MKLSILALCMAVLFALGCASERRAPARSANIGLPSLPSRVEFDPDAARAASAPSGEAFSDLQLTGPLAGAPAVRRTTEMYAVQQIYRRPGVSLSTVLYGAHKNRASSGAAVPEIDASTDPMRSAKIEREAQLGLVVKDVAAAAAYVLGPTTSSQALTCSPRAWRTDVVATGTPTSACAWESPRPSDVSTSQLLPCSAWRSSRPASW